MHAECGCLDSGIRIPTIRCCIYDDAISFFVGLLGFTLVKDEPRDAEGKKRWVEVKPSEGFSLVIMKADADDDRQRAAVGNQAGGKVGFFLQTDDFQRDYADYVAKGVKFLEAPRSEPWGTVVIFEDLYGNTWDMIQPAANA